MATLTIIEKTNGSGQPIAHGKKSTIDTTKLIGFETKSLYIRTGHMNGTLFLSQRGNGGGGAGDVIAIAADATLEVSPSLFERIMVLAEKANAVV